MIPSDSPRTQRFKEALREIVALDLGKTPDGRDDFYTGPDRFFRAWLIAAEALGMEVKLDV